MANLIAFLRFLNFLQDRPEPRLSWSHIGLVAALSAFLYLALAYPKDFWLHIAALAGLAPMVLNYMHQRQSGATADGKTPK